MAKRYIRINWQDKPSTATPLSATFLNKMDKGIDDIDNAVETLDVNKINNSNIANNLVTTTDGLVLDARQGKILDDKVNQLNSNLGDLSQFYKRGYILYEGTLLNFVLNNMPAGGIVSVVGNETVTDIPVVGAWGMAIIYRHASQIWTVKWIQDSVPDYEYINQIYIDHWMYPAWKRINYT